MNIAINAISAKLGGAVTYLQNVLPELKAEMGSQNEHRIIVWRGTAATGDQKWPEQIEYREDPVTGSHTNASASPLRRLWFDQIRLPQSLRADRTDVLFSSANFGPLRCPCRQVLLVRNTIPFDETYLARVTPKVKAYYLFQRWLTLRCIAAADIVIFPTQAMLDLVARYSNKPHSNWQVAYYGTRHDLFYPADNPDNGKNSPVNLLHVSLYSDQKNLGILLQAMQMLEQTQPQDYRLRLTAGFGQDWIGEYPFFPNFRREQALYYQLYDVGAVEDVDWKSYGTLPNLYRSADIFVFPSYTESFGHPLVEAMASGLPIVAADVPVNRELCGDAAIYFSVFDPVDCAKAIRQVAGDKELREKLRAISIARAQSFVWKNHALQLVEAFNAA